MRHESPMGASETLVRFVLSLNYHMIPSDVVPVTKRIILDTLGVGLAGSQEESSKRLLALIAKCGSQGQGTIFGQKSSFSCLDAALVNGSMAHALELEESHNRGGHPATAIIPAALAAAELTGISGRELLISVIAGYEVHCRIALASNPYDVDLGWHFTSLCGIFGATASSGKILNVSQSQMLNAFGLALSQASGHLLSEQDGSWAKRLQPGLAARGGLFSSLLAKAGWTGSQAPLETKGGFFDLYIRDYSLERMESTLGSDFEIRKSTLKQYPTCSFMHSAIDATLGLVLDCDIRPDEIRKVIVKVTRPTFKQTCQPIQEKRTPKNTVAAQFSLPFALAASIVSRHLGPDQLNERAIQNPSILAVAQRVVPELADPIQLSDEGQSTPSIVEIETPRGVFSRRVNHAKGSPENPLTDYEMKAKFVTCAEKANLSTEKIEAIIHIVSTLEEFQDLSPLWKLLRGHEFSHDGC